MVLQTDDHVRKLLCESQMPQHLREHQIQIAEVPDSILTGATFFSEYIFFLFSHSKVVDVNIAIIAHFGYFVRETLMFTYEQFYQDFQQKGNRQFLSSFSEPWQKSGSEKVSRGGSLGWAGDLASWAWWLTPMHF